jgi:hypothetical protein
MLNATNLLQQQQQSRGGPLYRNNFALFSMMLLFSFSFWASPFLPWQRNLQQANELVLSKMSNSGNYDTALGSNSNNGINNLGSNMADNANTNDLSSDLLMILDELANESTEEEKNSQASMEDSAVENVRNSEQQKAEDLAIIASHPMIEAPPSVAASSNEHDSVSSSTEDSNMFALTAYQHGSSSNDNNIVMDQQLQIMLQNQLHAMFLQFYDTYTKTLKYIGDKQSVINTVTTDPSARQMARLYPVSFLFSSMLNELGLDIDFQTLQAATATAASETSSNRGSGSAASASTAPSSEEKGVVPVYGGNYNAQTLRHQQLKQVFEIYEAMKQQQRPQTLTTLHTTIDSNNKPHLQHSYNESSMIHNTTEKANLVRYLRGTTSSNHDNTTNSSTHNEEESQYPFSNKSNTSGYSATNTANNNLQLEYPITSDELYEVLVLHDMVHLLKQYVELQQAKNGKDMEIPFTYAARGNSVLFK